MNAATTMEKINKAKEIYDAQIAYAEKTFQEAVAAATAKSEETKAETTEG